MLVSLLKLGTFLEMTSERKFAIHYITEDSFISPAKKIELARKFNVPQWIKPAFVALAYRTPLQITDEDIDLLGLTTYAILTKTHARIIRQRTLLSLAAPPMVHSEMCPSRYSCEAGWKEFWWTKVGRWLHHPDTPPRLTELSDHVGSIDMIMGVSMLCQQETVEKLRSMAALQKEIIIAEEGAAEVVQFHRTLGNDIPHPP